MSLQHFHISKTS